MCQLSESKERGWVCCPVFSADLIPYSWISPAVSQCLFPHVPVLDSQPHTPEQMVTALVLMQTDPGYFWHRGFGWMGHLICSLPSPWPSSSLSPVAPGHLPPSCHAVIWHCPSTMASKALRGLGMFMPGSPESFILCVTSLLISTW